MMPAATMMPVMLVASSAAVLTDRLPRQLHPGNWFISGDSGSGHAFDIYAPTTPNIMSAPVVVYIAGAGGKGAIPNYKNTPVPSWAVVFDVHVIGGGSTPTYLACFLVWLRSITQQTQNKIILVGFSRGAAWIIDLVQTQAANIDAAVALAGYPWTKDIWDNEREARRVMQVRIPVLLAHFDRDEFCHPTRYGRWFLQLAVAMQAPPGKEFGQRWKGFVSVVCKGNRETAYDIFWSMDFAQLSDGACLKFWDELWSAIAQAQKQAQQQ